MNQKLFIARDLLIIMSYSKLQKDALLKSATYLSIIVALIILLMKIFAFAQTNSVSLLASLVDSSLDITSSLINMIALRFALMPADSNHRFGHEKIQDLAVFGQSIFFIASSIFVIFSSVSHLHEKNVISNGDLGIYVMMASIAATFILVTYQSYVLSIANSNIIVADKLHYATDLFMNIGVIISIYFSKDFWFIDAVCAVLIALFLSFEASKLLRSAIKNLIDEEFSSEDKNKLIKILSSFKQDGEIIGVHDMKTRKASDKYFIQLHVEMDPEMKLYQSHIIIEKIEKRILESFHDSELIIHQDPYGHPEKILFREKLIDK